MKKMIWIGCFLGLWITQVAFAHHSPVVFDETQEITLVGEVVEFRWINPHSSIVLAVENQDGRTEAWDVELTSPTHLIRAGWRSTSLQPGDKVTITANPLRSGENVGKFVAATLEDGKELSER